MDWGIVASVVVGIVLFLVAVIILAVSMFSLISLRIKRQIRNGDTATTKMPSCPFAKSTEQPAPVATE